MCIGTHQGGLDLSFVKAPSAGARCSCLIIPVTGILPEHIKAKSTLDRVEGHQPDSPFKPLSETNWTNLSENCCLGLGGQNSSPDNLVSIFCFHYGRIGNTDVDVKWGEVESINIVD